MWLICLVAAAVLPVGALLLSTASGLRQARVAGVEGELRRAALLAAERVRARFELAHGTLAAFATVAAVREHDGAACSAIARAIVTHGERYGNIAAATTDGRVFCSSAAPPPRLSVADRLYFRRALRSSAEAVVGEYVVGRAIDRPLVHVAKPVFDAKGERTGVVFAAIDLADLSEQLHDVVPGEEALVHVVDGRGTILARQPQPGRWVGLQDASPLVGRMLAERVGIGEASGTDATRRLYAFAPVRLGGVATDVTVSVSLPKSAALAAVNGVTSRALAWYLLVGLGGIAAAWCVGEFGVARRIRQLAKAARRVTSGDLEARSGLRACGDEVGELTAAFDEMAAAIDGLTRQNRLILECAGIGILGIDGDGTLTFMNAAGADMLGWRSTAVKRADGTPRGVGDIACGPDTAARLLEVVRDGAARRGEDQLFQRASGTTFPASWMASPLRDGGLIVGAVVTFRDVSDRCQLERQVRQLQRMEALGHVAGGVAHDFNNLLSVILTVGQSLRDELVPADERRAAADDIVAAASRGAALTRQLLAFSRSEAPAPRVIDPNDVIGDLRKLILRLVGPDVVPSFRLASCGRVLVDASQLEQVVVNLVVNARDAMPEGGALTIETGDVELDGTLGVGRLGAPRGKYVLVAVNDEGSGIDDATLAQVFEPFFTTKGPGKGTGLGLSTVWNIVKRSGGDIEVHTSPGHGSSFRIYLPCIDASVTARAFPDAPADGGRRPSSANGVS